MEAAFFVPRLSCPVFRAPAFVPRRPGPGSEIHATSRWRIAPPPGHRPRRRANGIPRAHDRISSRTATRSPGSSPREIRHGQTCFNGRPCRNPACRPPHGHRSRAVGRTLRPGGGRSAPVWPPRRERSSRQRRPVDDRHRQPRDRGGVRPTGQPGHRSRHAGSTVRCRMPRGSNGPGPRGSLSRDAVPASNGLRRPMPRA